MQRDQSVTTWQGSMSRVGNGFFGTFLVYLTIMEKEVRTKAELLYTVRRK